MKELDSEGFRQTIESHYNLGQVLTLENVPNAGQNHGFRMETRTGLYFLRQYRKDISPRTVAYEPLLVDHLASLGLPVPYIIKNKDGHFVAKSVDGSFFCLETYIDGDTFPAEGLDLNQSQLINAAKTLVTFHEIMLTKKPILETPADISDYTTDQFFSVAKAKYIWEIALEAISQKTNIDPVDRLVLAVAPQKIAAIDRLDEERLNNMMRKMPSILAHGDFTPQNLIYMGDEIVGIVDWELARYQPRVWELLRAVCSFCKSDRTEIFNTPLDLSKAKEFISIYEDISPLSRGEKNIMFYLAYIASLFPYYLLSSRYIHLKEGADRLAPNDSADWNWWEDNHIRVTWEIFGK